MRVGAVVYATTQGLGYLAKDFFDHGVIDEVLIFRHPHGDRQTHAEWYPPGTPVLTGRGNFLQTHRSAVSGFLGRIDVLLAFETPFDWTLPDEARRRGKKTALMPMYEWFPERPPHRFDLYLCPSMLDHDVFTAMFPNYNMEGPRVERLNVPAPSGTWQLRKTARRFLHNAGHVGSRNHKGTDTLLEAMQFVESPLELTVRCQDASRLLRLRRNCGGTAGHSNVTFVNKEIPREDLFGSEHDVYVAPEKYNGLSLPLQEAFAAGMPVVTSDRYPHNTWLPREPLVPVAQYQRVRAAPGHLEIDEAVVQPRELARVLDGMYGMDVTKLSEAGRDWAAANSWEILGPRYRKAMEELL